MHTWAHALCAHGKVAVGISRPAPTGNNPLPPRRHSDAIAQCARSIVSLDRHEARFGIPSQSAHFSRFSSAARTRRTHTGHAAHAAHAQHAQHTHNRCTCMGDTRQTHVPSHPCRRPKATAVDICTDLRPFAPSPNPARRDPAQNPVSPRHTAHSTQHRRVCDYSGPSCPSLLITVDSGTPSGGLLGCGCGCDRAQAEETPIQDLHPPHASPEDHHRDQPLLDASWKSSHG